MANPSITRAFGSMAQQIDCRRFLQRCFIGIVVSILAGVTVTRAADHGDTPFLMEIERSDARLAGMFAFLRGENLVIILTSDPTIPAGVTEYIFPTDVKFRIAIDNNRPVSFDDLEDLEEYGGTVLQPNKIKPDIIFRIRFRDDNEPRIRVNRRRLRSSIRVFSGLRDDPFIRTPREGRNIAAIVLEMPLELVLREQSTLLIWGEAKVKGLKGKLQDLAARALRSQFPENDRLNELRPRKHFKKLGLAPDVIIFDTSRPASYPNGRELTDDVVDLVGIPLAGEADPSPTENDVPFLSEFPYLAPPQ